MRHQTAEYNVRLFIDETYEVIKVIRFFEDHIENDDLLEEEKVYQGSLTDCYSYIKLKEGNYLK